MQETGIPDSYKHQKVHHLLTPYPDEPEVHHTKDISGVTPHDFSVKAQSSLGYQ